MLKYLSKYVLLTCALFTGPDDCNETLVGHLETERCVCTWEQGELVDFARYSLCESVCACVCLIMPVAN